MNKIKNYIRRYFPERVSRTIIFGVKFIKRKVRDSRRHRLGGSGAFIKNVIINGLHFSILLDPVKNGGVDESIARFGFWEKDLGNQLQNNIHQGDVFLDIGANIGYHSLFVASLLKNTGMVYAYEPIPRLCDQIKKSIALNGYGNIEVNNFGLAESDKEVEIYLRDENTGGSSVLKLVDNDAFVAESSLRVHLRRFDDFWNKSIRVAALKIDIEGYELEALRGASEMLRRDKPIIFIEFSPKIYILDYVEKPKDLIDFLSKIGYKFFTLGGDEINLGIWLESEEHCNSQIDLMCKTL